MNNKDVEIKSKFVTRLNDIKNTWLVKYNRQMALEQLMMNDSKSKVPKKCFLYDFVPALVIHVPLSLMMWLDYDVLSCCLLLLHYFLYSCLLSKH